MLKGFITAAFLLIFLATGVQGKEPDTGPEPVTDPPETISAVRITIEHPPPGTTHAYWTTMAEKLIQIRTGDRLTGETVDAAISMLRVSGEFAAVHVDSDQDGERLYLQFNLTPFRRIKKIRIHHPFPLFQKQVLRAMSLTHGDVYLEEKLAEQAGRIEALYKKEGFVSADADVMARVDPEDGQMVIDVSIEKGSYYRLAEFEIKGNDGFSNGRLKLRLRSWLRSKLPWSAGRIVDNDLKVDKKALIDFYRKRGYPEVAVTFDIKKDDNEKTMGWIVDILEGPRYTVEFKGNRYFSNRKLKNDLVIFKKGNINDIGLQRSVKNIQTRYRDAGFHDARIVFAAETHTFDQRPVRRILFTIDEGVQTVVDAVQITGNRSLAEKTLAGQVHTRPPGYFNDGGYVPEVLDEDLQALETVYLQKGFLSPDIQETVALSPDRTTAIVNIRIDEGIRSLVSSISFEGVHVIPVSEALAALQLKPGEPFQDEVLKNDENTLAGMISEKGYPHVVVTATAETLTPDKQVVIVFRVAEGPLVRMGQVYCTGNFRTRAEIITRKIKLKPGDPFSLKKLIEGQKEIRKMQSLSAVEFKYPGLKKKADTVNLFIEVKEKKPFYLESGLGYDTERGAFADARMGDLNLMGANRNVWLAGDVSDIGYLADFGLTEPDFLGSPVSSHFGLYTERRKEFNKSYGLERHGTALSFSRKWSDRLQVGLGLRLEHREQYDRDPMDVLQPEELEPRKLFAITPSLAYDGRDSFVHPKKGFAVSFSLDFSTALEGDLDDFINYRFNGQYYLTPFDRLTLAFIGRVGYIDPYGNGLVPEDQLYFLGGASTVRGYRENMLRFNDDDEAVGGREAISGTVEARIDVGGNFELALFFDTGRVGDPILEVGPTGFRSSVGGGLRYLTPVGPIGLLYGYKLDRQAEESPGRIHFSIGYSF